MVYDKFLNGRIVKLRALDLSDCTQEYVGWLSNHEISQYLETRWTDQSLETILDFVKSIRESSDSYIFAIMYEGKHVGNIKIGPINFIHRYADISYFLGNATLFGKGIMTEAVNLICDFGFNILRLHKICAGAYKQNIGSQKVLLKNGFIQEGIKRCQYYAGFCNDVDMGGGYDDAFLFGLLDTEFKKL